MISGNVHRVSYQSGKSDQWHHAYAYDADNRITEVFTTMTTPITDPKVSGQTASQNEAGLTAYWDREAQYTYYDHGPLARVDLGQEQVQGMDYIYTLQGWIKDVNSNTLDPTRDPGQDGNQTNDDRKNVARDVMGFSLHYYEGDYASIDGDNSFAASLTGSDLTANSSDLYNGNIGKMVTTITNPTTREILPLGNAYKYDQLNRLKQARSYSNIDLATNAWGANGALKYENGFTYDANGNILTQLRKDQNNATIDNLTYQYNKNSAGKMVQNRLYHVNDTEPLGSFTDDIDDQGVFDPGTLNEESNYRYDAEGRLIKDVQEGIENIEWRVDGKVKRITRPVGSNKRNIVFQYDAMGNRVAKNVYNDANALVKSTFYMLDATGNVVSVYERNVDVAEQQVSFNQEERHIYGASRLGVMTRPVNLLNTAPGDLYMGAVPHDVGFKMYELSDHRRNINSTISDKPIPSYTSVGQPVNYYMADIRQATDYTPFGVELAGRKFLKAGAEDFRFGFQGQESDDELKGEGNSVNYTFRMHDPRLGRFSSIDPLTYKYPELTPYQFSSNCPIYMIELEGLEGIASISGRNTFMPGLQQFTVQGDANYDMSVTPDEWDAWMKAGSLGIIVSGTIVIDIFATKGWLSRGFLMAAVGQNMNAHDRYYEALKRGDKEAMAKYQQQIRETGYDIAYGIVAELGVAAVKYGMTMVKTGLWTPTQLKNFKYNATKYGEGTAIKYAKGQITRQQMIRGLSPKSVDDIMVSATAIKAKANAPEQFFSKTGTYDDALDDFYSLEGLSDVKPLSGSNFQGFQGVLPDGTKVSVRTGSTGKASGGASSPTLQINPANGQGPAKKIRYSGG